MGKKDNAERTQMEIASLEDLVPRNSSQRYCPRLQQMVFMIQKACLLTALTSKPVPILINIIMRLSEKKHAVMRRNCRKKSKGIVRNTERSH